MNTRNPRFSRRRIVQAGVGLTAALAPGCTTVVYKKQPSAASAKGASPRPRDVMLAPPGARGVIANPFRAGRSMTMSRNGIVASSHVLASQAGLDMLRAGGTAMDAAVATAAVLNVVEPMSTGIGGDAFFIYYEAATRKLHGFNGSGRSPRELSREYFTRRGADEINARSWEAVTVPGAFDAFVSGVERYGRKTIGDLLEPAIRYAEEGFAVAEVVAEVWQQEAEALRTNPESARTYLIQGRAPGPGDLFRNPDLARTLRTLADGGRDAFYRGPIARQIVEYAQRTGGFLSLDDFAAHRGEWVEPITTNYRGYDVHQIPPNGQGVGVLMMLNLLEGFDLRSMTPSGPEYLHLLIEAKKLVYADLYHYVGDPKFRDVPVGAMLSKGYAAERRGLIDPHAAADVVDPGLPAGTDTVYLTAIDADGNACSFINSIYWLFGSAITAGRTGILLQNRGGGFKLTPGHFNEYAPGKRPYHTIIPGMVTRNDRLYMSFGLMGGPMQPQGQLQFLLHHLDFGFNIQQANDIPRWQHTEGRNVLFEYGTPTATVRALEQRGHIATPAPHGAFGGAQAILVDPETGTYFASSDPRKDGAALAY